jgi:paraquat-inducible protein B
VSARAHPRLVGAFVLVAVALVLAAVMALGTGAWFAPSERFCVFFPGSVRGLNPGSPVTFRGIKLGEVKEVTAFLTGREDPLVQIEVVFEARRDIIEVPPGIEQPFARLYGQAYADELIRRGIRARMLSQSLLTGQRYIDLDLQPGEPARLAGLSRRYPELPTTPTALEKLGDQAEKFFAKLAELPLDQMLDDVRRAIQSLRELLESPDLKAGVADVHRALEALAPALREARAAFADARTLVDTLGTQVKQTGGAADDTLRDARRTLERGDQALGKLERTLEGTDQTQVSATQALEDLTHTLRALRNLVDYIQTHPEAVVLGKQKAGKKK